MEIRCWNLLEVKKLKGIQKWVVKKNICFDNYYECLFEKREHYADTTSIRSFKHKIKTLSARKKALIPFDDKRYLLKDGITSLPFGHKACGLGEYIWIRYDLIYIINYIFLNKIRKVKQTNKMNVYSQHEYSSPLQSLLYLESKSILYNVSISISLLYQELLREWN